MSIWDIILRLSLAAILGGIIGLERENKRRAAGLRTHMLVSVGSALAMVTSVFIFEEFKGLTNLDPARLGAQVISGIGFLGAGTIIKQGISVRGLTTAASLWAVACIGLAVGIGFWTAAIIAAVIVVLTLFIFSKLERKIFERQDSHPIISVKAENRPGQLGEIASAIGKAGANITNIELDEEGKDEIIIHFYLNLPKGISKSDLIDDLKTLPGIRFIE